MEQNNESKNKYSGNSADYSGYKTPVGTTAMGGARELNHHNIVTIKFYYHTVTAGRQRIG